jgi:two-component system, NarL family, nitrate/nitrite response regulator NarL
MNAYSPSHALQDVSSPRLAAIRVLIAEDTPMGCQLLKDGLKRSRLGLGEIYCAGTVNQVVALCNLHPVDVALISEDLQDGPHKGVEAVELLRKSQPNIRCVVLVRKIRRELTLEAFRNGAKGIFCRMEPIETLGKCILAVHKGQVWADSEQLGVILEALVEVKPIRVTNLLGTCLLTKREEQVATLVADGLTNREVAKKLGLSEHTVSNYLFRIYEKLGISNRVEFVLYIFGRRQQNQANIAPATSRMAENQHPRR